MNAFREMFSAKSAKYGREIQNLQCSEGFGEIVEIYFVKTQMHKIKVAWVPLRILGLWDHHIAGGSEASCRRRILVSKIQC